MLRSETLRVLYVDVIFLGGLRFNEIREKLRMFCSLKLGKFFVHSLNPSLESRYVEDGSLEELSRRLCEAFRLVENGCDAELRAKLAALQPPDLSAVREIKDEAEAAQLVSAVAGQNAEHASNLADRLHQVDLAVGIPHS